MKDRLKKLYKLFDRKEKLRFLYLFFLMIIASALEVAGVGVIPAFIVSVMTPEKFLNIKFIGPLMQEMNITTSQDILIWGSIALMTVFIIKNIFLYFFVYTKSNIIRNQQITLSDRMFKAYMYAPYSFLLKRDSATLLRNVKGEVRLIVQNISLNVLKMTMDAMIIISILVFLLFLEPLITICTFVLIGGVSSLFLKFIKKKIDSYGKAALKERKNSIVIINQGLGGIKDTSVLHKQNYFTEKYYECVTIASNALKFKEIATGSIKPLLETLIVSSMLFVGLLLVIQNRPVDTIVPILVLFGTASLRILPAVRELVASFTGLKYSTFSIDPVYKDLKLLENIKEKSVDSGEEIKLKEKIEIRNLSFSYNKISDPVLKNISLTIPKGFAVAFVGPTGAGKSTLIDIILGLLKPSDGKIVVDGTDIGGNISGWQKNIGYVPQVIYLADNSIKFNIAWGMENEEIDEDKLQQAIKTAQLEQLIKELPNGLNTFVGERGIRLSGGQRQRIGIARALYNNPQVLILDEATSSLDNKTEKYVIEAIDKLKGSRTVIVIAHRLTTVKNADVLYYLNRGELINSGTYDELLEKSKEFRIMSTI